METKVFLQKLKEMMPEFNFIEVYEDGRDTTIIAIDKRYNKFVASFKFDPAFDDVYNFDTGSINFMTIHKLTNSIVRIIGDSTHD